MKNQPPPRASVLVVVMEAGARWPSWTGELRTSAPDVVIIAQQRDDDAGAFESP